MEVCLGASPWHVLDLGAAARDEGLALLGQRLGGGPGDRGELLGAKGQGSALLGVQETFICASNGISS